MASETHGGMNLAEMRRLGIAPEAVLDFSTNVNPLGPSPLVVDALANLDIASYPDPTSLKLRETLANLNEVSRQELLAGNGTAELIWLVCRVSLKPGSTVVVAGPTFGEYRRAAEACGADVVEIRANPPTFQPDLTDWLAAIEEHQPRLFFLCNPNNPTGWHLTEAEIVELAEALPAGMLVLDEAYRGFTTLGPFGRRPHPNAIVLRSMTKDFGLAGLRLGYLLAPPTFLDSLRGQQPPWSVSSAAQAAGLAALGDLAHLDQSVVQTREWATRLRAGLAESGAEIAPTEMHYFMVQVGDALETRRQLLRDGCLVRDATSFGLPRWIRIGTRTPPDNKRLLKAWHRRRLLQNQQPKVNEGSHVN